MVELPDGQQVPPGGQENQDSQSGRSQEAASPDKSRRNEHLFQQTFLGASITNFSINLGLNSEPTTLNISLVEDKKERRDSPSGKGKGFFRNPNAVLEGYHPWDLHAFPLELYRATPEGVTFGVECVDADLSAGVNGTCRSEPFDLLGIGAMRPWRDCECDDLVNRRAVKSTKTLGSEQEIIESHTGLVPDYQTYGDLFFKPNAGSPVYFNYQQRRFGINHPRHIPPPLVTDEDPDDYADLSVFEFNGIFTSVNETFDDRGKTFQVVVEDPRVILEGTKILLGEKYISTTVPADNVYEEPVIDFHDGKNPSKEPWRSSRPIRNLRGFRVPPKLPVTFGYNGYYNLLNVFGYYEFAWKIPSITGGDRFSKSGSKTSNVSKGRFGNADYSETGMVWYDPDRPEVEAPFGSSQTQSGMVERHAFGIIPALQFMLMGDSEEYLKLNEPMGGPLYYGVDNLNTKKTIEATLIDDPDDILDKDKNSPYRYKVDLSDLYQLHKTTNPGRKINVVDATKGKCVNEITGLEMVDGHGDPLYRSKSSCEANAGLRWDQDGECYDKSTSPPTLVSGKTTRTECEAAGYDWTDTMRGMDHWGGNLDSTLRIDETEISLLSLIQTICEEAGADFFVELVRDPLPFPKGPGYILWEGPAKIARPSPQDSTYAGTIKIRVIPRHQQNYVIPNIVHEAIDQALVQHEGYWTEEQFDFDGSSMGYNEPIIQSADVGYQFNDIPTGVMMMGGQRTRVVGVTPLGGIKFRYDEGYDYNNDGLEDAIADEWLPSTEFDGAFLGYITSSIPRQPQPPFGLYTDERMSNRCVDIEGSDIGADVRDECLGAGICIDPSGKNLGQKSQFACVDGTDNTWGRNEWVGGFSNDDYRAWSNDFHIYDIDRELRLSRMDKLNLPSKGKCMTSQVDPDTGIADPTTPSVPDPNLNGEELCEGGGKCFYCEGALGQMTFGLCGAAGGKWTAYGGIDTRSECEELNLLAFAEHFSWESNTFELGDGYLDLYPMWGFKTETRELISTPSDGFVKTTVRGDPIMGLFHDDDPYRDFDSNDGIYSTKQFFNRFQGVCSDTGRDTDKFGAKLGYAEYMENCLNEKTCEIKEGIRVEVKKATGNTYRLHCWHPYAKEFVEVKSSQDVDEDGNVSDRVKWQYIPMKRPDGAFNCIFYDKPDGKKGIDSIRQAMKGECYDDAYSSKCDCDKNAICKDGLGDAVSVTSKEECQKQGMCIDDSTGAAVPHVSRNECEEVAGDPAVAWRWVYNHWTGFDDGKGDLVKPYTASIPINFDIIDKYKYGPTSPHHRAPVSESYYYATVTELRHAAIDQDSWMKYLDLHDSWLPCVMGWKECVMDQPANMAGLKAAMEFWFSGLEGVKIGYPPSIATGTKVDPAIYETYVCEGVRNDLTPEEEEKMEKNFLWKILNEVATSYYGKTYLVSLPFGPPMEEGCSSGAICVDDSDMEIFDPSGSRITNESDCTDMGAIWKKYETKEECENDYHIWGLHGIQSEWVTAISPVRHSGGAPKHIHEAPFLEHRWDIASEAWPFNTAGFCFDKGGRFSPTGVILDANTEEDCLEFAITEGLHWGTEIDWEEDLPIMDNTIAKQNLRYPPSTNFWSSTGNLQPFVSFPKTEVQRLRPGVDSSRILAGSHNERHHDLSFRRLNPETFHHDLKCRISNEDATSDGTVFVKAQVDPKTYWLPQNPTWEMHHTQFYERQCWKPSGTSTETLLPHVLSQKECETSGDDCNEWRGAKFKSTFLRPYALITLNDSVRYDRPDVYQDERAQHYPDGQPFPNDCEEIKPECLRLDNGTVTVETGPVTREECEDLGLNRTWRAKKARHECAYHPGCKWMNGVTCLDSEGVDTGGKDKALCLASGKCFYCWDDAGAVIDTTSTTRADCIANGFEWAESPIGSRLECDAEGPVGGYHWKANIWIKGDVCLAKKVDSDGSKLVDGITLCIPLTKIKDTRSSGAWLKAAITNFAIRPDLMKEGSDINRAPMISAAYKPYYAGVPQQSNRHYWGPWARGKGWGKVLYKNDSSYHPAAFGAESEMGAAARARCLADVNEFLVNQETESGSVTLTGPPFYKLGDFVSFSKLPPGITLPPGIPVSFYSSGPIGTPFFGPLLTDISVDVSTEGIITTYSMDRQIKFGNLAAIYEQRMRESIKRINKLQQKQEDDLRRSRLPDPLSFREGYKDI